MFSRSSVPPSNGIVLERLVDDASFSLVAWGDLLALLWHEAPCADGYRKAYSAAKLLALRHPGRQVAVLSLSAQTSPPDKEAKLAIEQILQDPERAVRRSAVVHEGGGFIAATVRSMVLNMLLRGGSRVPHRAFHDLTEALEWIFEDFPEATPSKNALELVARQLRRRLMREGPG